MKCPECGGTKTIRPKGAVGEIPCPHCQGTGEVPDVELTSAKILMLELFGGNEDIDIGRNTFIQLVLKIQANQREVDADICEQFTQPIILDKLIASGANMTAIGMAARCAEAIKEGK